MRRQVAPNLQGPSFPRAIHLLLSQPGQSCGQGEAVGAPLILAQACLKVRPASLPSYLYNSTSRMQNRTLPLCELAVKSVLHAENSFLSHSL